MPDRSKARGSALDFNKSKNEDRNPDFARIYSQKSGARPPSGTFWTCERLWPKCKIAKFGSLVLRSTKTHLHEKSGLRSSQFRHAKCHDDVRPHPRLVIRRPRPPTVRNRGQQASFRNEPPGCPRWLRKWDLGLASTNIMPNMQRL